MREVKNSATFNLTREMPLKPLIIKASVLLICGALATVSSRVAVYRAMCVAVFQISVGRIIVARFFFKKGSSNSVERGTAKLIQIFEYLINFASCFESD